MKLSSKLSLATIFFATILLSITNAYAQKGQWYEIQKLVPFDSSGYSAFGYNIDLSDGFIVVGAPKDDRGNNEDTATLRSGAVYVYNLQNGRYVPFQKLVSPIRLYNVWYGSNVVIDNENLVVGAFNQPNIPTGLGKAFYYRKGSGGYWQLSQILSPPDTTYYFGEAIDMNENFLVIGAWADNNGTQTDTPILGAGAVYIYKKVNEQWELLQKITASTRKVYDLFGQTLDLEDSMIVIGANGRDQSIGAAYIFVQSGDTFREKFEITPGQFFPPRTSEKPGFGTRVVFGEGDVAITSPGHDYSVDWTYNVDNLGMVYVLDVRDSVVKLTKRYSPTYNVPGSFYGSSVCFSGSDVFIGGRGLDSFYKDKTHFHNSGGVIFNFDNVARAEILPSDRQEDAEFGQDLVFKGKTLVVSAPGVMGPVADSTGITGAVYVFSSEQPVGINQQEISDMKLLYPNPARNLIHVPAGLVSYQLFDIYGRNIASGPLENNTIDLMQVRSGWYRVVLENIDGTDCVAGFIVVAK